MNNHELTYLDLITKYQKDGGLSRSNLKLLEEVGYKAARSNFEIYCYMMRSDYKDFKWLWYQRHIMKRINAKINRLVEPEDSVFPHDYNITHPRILLNMGDQLGKTTIACEMLSTWLLGKEPNARIIYVTYNDARAKSLYRPVLRILRSPMYRKIFPEFMLADEIDLTKEGRSARNAESISARKITNANQSVKGHKGGLIMAGIGNVLGESADYILADDLLTQKEAYSEKERESKYELWTGTILSRQQAETIIISVGTWWHREDIIGMTRLLYIEGEKKGLVEDGVPLWELIEFTTQKDERYFYYDHRQIGEYLTDDADGIWKKKSAVFKEMKHTNMRLWNIKHMNIPDIGLGVIWKDEDFIQYDVLPCDIRNMIIWLSIDPNFTEKSATKGKQVDSAGITIWGLWDRKLYLLDFEDVPMGLDTLLQYAKTQQTRFKNKGCNVFNILVEAKANGYGFYDMSKLYDIRNVNKFNVHEFGDKRERATLSHPYFINNKIFVPNNVLCPAIDKYKGQLVKFIGDGKGKDDLVDSTSQIILHLRDYLIDKPIVIEYHAPITRNEFMSVANQRAKQISNNTRKRLYG